MKNIFKILLIFAMYLTSGCGSSDEYMFGRPIFESSENIKEDRKEKLDKVEVKKGDTLYSISREHNVPLRDLIEINNLEPPYNLMIEQTLIIPQNRYHMVKKGDTIYNISKRYSVDITSLSRVNNIKAPYNISIGDKLLLPASTTASAYIKDAENTVETKKEASIPLKKEPTTTAAAKKTVAKTSKTSNPRSTNVQKANLKTTKKKSTTQTSSRNSSPRLALSSSTKNVKLSWPLRGPIISRYGVIGKGQKNDGINIKAKAGTNVIAAERGTVVYAGNELKGFGNLILIKHPNNWVTAYAHNERIFVRKGQLVRKGEKISAVGKTGSVSTPQLHFELHVNKKPINPMPHLN